MVYVSDADQLDVQVQSIATALILEIRWRMLLTDQTIQINREVISLPNPGSFVNVQYQLPEGFLLGVLAQPIQANPGEGDTFVRLGLARGRGAAAQLLQVFAASFCTLTCPTFWPNGRVMQKKEGMGTRQTRTAVVPPPGNELIDNLDAFAYRERIISYLFTLSTSAVAGNREVFFRLIRGGVPVFQGGANFLQPPSSLHAYLAGENLTVGPSGSSTHNICIPRDYDGQFNDSWQTLTPGLAAGDQYTVIGVYCDRKVSTLG